MTLTCQGFCENVSELNICRNMRQDDNSMVIRLPNWVTINLYVLRSFMVNRICGIWMTLVLSACSGAGFACEKSSSERRPRSQIISKHAVDMARYSASVDDLEIESCFLHFQEIGASPKNIHQPVVDFCVFGHPSQSKSLYAWSCIDAPVRKKKPQLEVPSRYLIIQCTAERCKCRGNCMNLLTVWTANEMPGLVMVR